MQPLSEKLAPSNDETRVSYTSTTDVPTTTKTRRMIWPLTVSECDSRNAPERLTLCGVLVGLRQTPPITSRALEDDYGPGGSDGEDGEGSMYGHRGGQDEEDDYWEISDESGDESDDGSTSTSHPAIAAATERGAVVRAGEVSTAAVPDRRENSLYAVLLCDTSVAAGLSGEVEGRGKRGWKK